MWRGGIMFKYCKKCFSDRQFTQKDRQKLKYLQWNTNSKFCDVCGNEL